MIAIVEVVEEDDMMTETAETMEIEETVEVVVATEAIPGIVTDAAGPETGGEIEAEVTLLEEEEGVEARTNPSPEAALKKAITNHSNLTAAFFYSDSCPLTGMC